MTAFAALAEVGEEIGEACGHRFRSFEMRQRAAALEDLEASLRDGVQPEIGGFDRRRQAGAPPADPGRHGEPFGGVGDAVVEVAGEIGGEGRLGPRFVGAAIVVVDDLRADPFGVGEDVSSK